MMHHVEHGLLILTINGGSSSIKFALYEKAASSSLLYSGMIQRIGNPGGTMTVVDQRTGRAEQEAVEASDHQRGAVRLLEWLDRRIGLEKVCAVGHRIVHGGAEYSKPKPVTTKLLQDLRRISPYDPEHMPAEICLITTFQERCPGIMHVACFDTSFHRDMPRVARLLAIPRRYEKVGLRRYGFHGLSCTYLMKELVRLGGNEEANGRVILAHLGNGSSMTAVRGGRSLDTTMGFTPTAGLPMSRRSGDLDPGIVSYLARTEGMGAEQFHRMVNQESGLLGISELSSDMRDLLEQEQGDERAAEAIALYCYQARRTIGSLAAAMGGLDTLVFSAGIGENSPAIRARICDGLDFLGIGINRAANEAGAPVISKEEGRVRVRVIPTDEESEIASSVRDLLVLETTNKEQS